MAHREKRPVSGVAYVALVALVLCAQLLPGCTKQRSGSAVHVTVRLVDDETGEPVSRAGNYVHAFNDATGHQASLDPADETEFELEMPAPEIRLRVPDRTNTYELFEEDFVAKDGVLDVEIRLRPTHWIRLHGTLLWKDTDGTLRPLSEGDGNVRKAALSAGRGVGFEPGSDGAYSVNAPREVLEIVSINTNYRHAPTRVDLSNETGDDYALDLVLSPSR